MRSVPDNFLVALDKLLHSSTPHLTNDFIFNNRAKLMKSISRFHMQANTMTTSVRHGLALLNDPTTHLFVSAHQPNLFAYSGVFKKIVMLQTLKRIAERHDHKMKAINLFLIADHDFVGDIWIHYAELPSVRHSLGILQLRFPVGSSMRHQMVCNTPPPGQQILESWRDQIDVWIRNSCSSSSPNSNSPSLDDNIQSCFHDNFKQFWRQVEYAYSGAKSYSDFNSFLMSQIVNRIWGYDTLFVRLTDISSVFEDGIKFFISNFEKYLEAIRESDIIFSRDGVSNHVSSGPYAPVWLHCKCGSKAAAKLHEKEQEMIVLEGTCMSCKKDCQLNLGNKHKLERLNEVIPDLSPRAIPILLLLSRDLGVSCYASGSAGLRYIVHGSLAFRKLSIEMPLTIVWPARDIYYGIGQLDALRTIQLTTHSDVKRYLEELKQKNAEYDIKIPTLIAERMQRINAGEPIETLLSEVFSLKEEQRKTRRLSNVTNSVKNAIDMKPCFVDYAVNFGMLDTEIQWRENLLSNNNLYAPIVMKIRGKI
jgi:hypothetical protein